jgi:hypothetical protein
MENYEWRMEKTFTRRTILHSPFIILHFDDDWPLAFITSDRRRDQPQRVLLKSSTCPGRSGRTYTAAIRDSRRPGRRLNDNVYGNYKPHPSTAQSAEADFVATAVALSRDFNPGIPNRRQANRSSFQGSASLL